ncbi:MAG: glycosyltransferase, partial [Candidatus Eisenbacteria bacterium]
MKPALSVIIVSYRSQGVLGACLDSLAAARAEIALEVIVVDNASGDGTAEWLRGAYPWITLVEAGENRGYGAGVNLGVTDASGAALLVLNPDSIVPAGALPALAAALAATPHAAIVA